MTRRNIQSLIVLAAVAVILPGCSRHGAPKRPDNVPASAAWAGNGSRGAFITCSLDQMMNANPCTVYNDRTGAVEASGLYILRGSGTAASRSDLHYSGFDGTRIFLDGGKILEPMQSQAPSHPTAPSVPQ